jgi:hypothetical protein
VPVLSGTDSSTRAYHVGMTIAQSMVNQILYSLHRSGSLCLKLTSADVKNLTGGGFSLNASVLSLLASDLNKLAEDAAPVILQLKPRFAPHVELGSGAVTGVDMDGNDIVDWLIKLSLREIGIAFHVLVHDRYVRIFEVTTDISVGLNVNILPDNTLEASVGDLSIDNFQEVFNEILPNADFAQVLPTLIDVALQALLQNELKFDLDITNTLSDALGGAPIYMRINDIFRDGANDDYLTLSMTFSDTPGAPLMRRARTMARLAPQHGLVDHVDGIARATGKVRLVVGEELPYDQQRALEYQVRVGRRPVAHVARGPAGRHAARRRSQAAPRPRPRGGGACPPGRRLHHARPAAGARRGPGRHAAAARRRRAARHGRGGHRDRPGLALGGARAARAVRRRLVVPGEPRGRRAGRQRARAARRRGGALPGARGHRRP